MKLRWPLITTAIIFVQIVLGGVVVGKDAGFICPDWPLCHGMILPKLTGLVVLELVHRATAVLVTIFVIAIAVAIWRKHRADRRLARLAAASVFSLFAQVIVGGLIVIWQLPGITTTIDVANSMFLLGLYVVLTMEVHRRRHPAAQDVQYEAGALAPAAWLSMCGIASAVLVGAVFRHTGASEALFGFNHYLASHGQYVIPSQLMARTTLMLHVISGVFAAVTAIWFLVQAIRVGKLRASACAVVILVAVQMMLGMMSLDTVLAFWPVMLHWSNAAVLTAFVTGNLYVTAIAPVAIKEPENRDHVPVPDMGPVQ